MADAAPVVTGIGVVSPAGRGLDEFGVGISASRSYVTELGSAADGLRMFGAPVPDDQLADLPSVIRRRFDRVVHLATVAAADAMAMAGGERFGGSYRFALSSGSGFVGVETMAEGYDRWSQGGWRKINPFGVPAVMGSTVAAFLAQAHGARGQTQTFAGACASGTQALIEAAELIRSDRADVVLAGGAEAILHPFVISAFARMDALCLDGDADAASRPFDVDRRGFAMGEGAAYLVLRRADHARADGDRILAEVLGGGQTCDAASMVAPDESGEAIERCVRAALEQARLGPSDITHINAHGTGTPANDAVEAGVVNRVFGPTVPVTSTKGSIGHLVGAAGAVEAVATVLAARQGTVAPTINCQALDPAFEIDVVRGESRTITPGPALSCSYAFGGQNAAIVLAPTD